MSKKNHKKAQKLEQKAIVTDVKDRIMGRPVMPRCPQCHQVLKIVYTAKRIRQTESLPPLYDGTFHGQWCPCGASVNVLEPEVVVNPSWGRIE